MVVSKTQFHMRELFGEAKQELKRELMEQNLFELDTDEFEQQKVEDGEARKALLIQEKTT